MNSHSITYRDCTKRLDELYKEYKFSGSDRRKLEILEKEIAATHEAIVLLARAASQANDARK